MKGPVLSFIYFLFFINFLSIYCTVQVHLTNFIITFQLNILSFYNSAFQANKSIILLIFLINSYYIDLPNHLHAYYCFLIKYLNIISMFSNQISKYHINVFKPNYKCEMLKIVLSNKLLFKFNFEISSMNIQMFVFLLKCQDLNYYCLTEKIYNLFLRLKGPFPKLVSQG